MRPLGVIDRSRDRDKTEPSVRISRTSTERLWSIVGIYVAATLLGSAALLVVQRWSGIDSDALSLVQFGPAVGALFCWILFDTTLRGLAPTPLPTARVRTDLGYLVAACVIFGVLLAGMAATAGYHPPGPKSFGGVPFGLLLVLQLIGACGEEIGWRGLLQPVLETHYRRWLAILVTGVIWALWHVQVIAAGPVIALSFLVSTVTFAILLGTLGNGGVRQRIAVATVGHWLINMMTYLAVGADAHTSPQVMLLAVAAAIVTAALGLRTLRRD